MNFINYIIENKEEIIAVASSVVALASLVAALTPTPKDDSWVGKAYKIVELTNFDISCNLRMFDFHTFFSCPSFF